MSKNRNTLALLNSKAPFTSNAGKDSLDVALVFASFEQPTALFFQGDGVYQLISGQDASLLSIKDYLKTFSAFEFYDIEDIYIFQSSLEARKLACQFHIDGVQILTQSDFSATLLSYRTVLRF